MPVVADTHVHLHDVHRPEDLLRAAFANLRRLAGGLPAGSAARVLCLAERRGRQAFRGLAAGEGIGGGFRARASAEPGAIVITGPGGDELWLVAGRQIVTLERLEVLALAVDMDAADGLPASTVVDRVLAAGGVPVIAWAPGKWLFSRGKVVAETLRRYGPSRIAVGDSTLRPVGCPEPRLMAGARRAGHAVLAGSDPLPFPGEESKVATYGVLLDGDLVPSAPVSSLAKLLLAGGGRRAGRRDGPLEVVRRLRRHARAKA